MCVCGGGGVCVGVCFYHNFFYHLSIVEQLGCFHIFAIMNNGAISTGLQVSLWGIDFIFFGYVPNSGIAEIIRSRD